MSKKIMITGGLGHIGSKLIRSIEGYDIVIVDNLATQRYCSLFNMGRDFLFIDKGFEDITNKELEGVYAVIHLGAIADAASSSKNKTETWNVNVKLTKEFIDRVSDSDVELFLFPSTTSVYGKSIDVVYEDDETCVNPQSPYADSKIHIENYLIEKDISYTILRFGTIFGGSIGMRFHTAINKFCYQASYGKPLTVWRENYEQVRPYLGLDDCIEAVKIILSNKNSWNKTYNVLTGNYSLKSIINTIKDVTKVELNFVDTPLLNQHTYNVDFSKMSKLGFTPKVSLKEEIKKTISQLK